MLFSGYRRGTKPRGQTRRAGVDKYVVDGPTLALLRRQKPKVTQLQVAVLMKVSQTRVSAIERQRLVPKETVIRYMAAVAEARVEYRHWSAEHAKFLQASDFIPTVEERDPVQEQLELARLQDAARHQQADERRRQEKEARREGVEKAKQEEVERDLRRREIASMVDVVGGWPVPKTYRPIETRRPGRR